MTAYYNEIDPYAAQWLKNLIEAGHIAPGDVDERSIEDVRPDDLKGYTQCHFFAGVGVWSLALRRAGWEDSRPIWTGSCPCQPFSASGKQSGFADERHLWPSFYWLIEQCRPGVVAGEQVASKSAEPWLDLVQSDLEALGYAFGALAFPSAGVGAPHIRDRTYWVGVAGGEGLEGQRRGYTPTGGQRSGSVRPTAEAGEPVRVADGDSSGCTPGSEGRPTVGHRETFESDCGALGLGDPSSPGPLPVTQSGVHRSEESARSRDVELERPGSAGGLADTEHDGRGRPQSNQAEPSGDGPDFGIPDRGHPSSEEQPAAGPINGFWRDADWLFCRDGKWRPVEPGTFPLVDGPSRGVGSVQPALARLYGRNRTGRLKGYGNAINADAASAFAATVRSILDDQHPTA